MADRLHKNITAGPPSAPPGRPQYDDPNTIPFDARIEQLRKQGWWSPEQIGALTIDNVFKAFDTDTKEPKYIHHIDGVEPPPPPDQKPLIVGGNPFWGGGMNFGGINPKGGMNPKGRKGFRRAAQLMQQMKKQQP